MCKIHYQDEHLLVVEKPAGLLSVPGRGADKQDCLINRLKQDFPTALMVHRLDMATSGLLVVALTKQMHRLLSELFASRQVFKSYQAIVQGRLEEQEGEVNLPLICDWPNRPRQMVDHENGKPSTTRYEVLSYSPEDDQTRVKLYPITGRTHQLRVHMLSLGHAILGDKLYMSEDEASKDIRLYLHAEVLTFLHPLDSHEINVISPAPF